MLGALFWLFLSKASAQNCAPLAISETRKIHLQADQTGSGLAAKYLLSKIDENHYEIGVHPQFVPGTESDVVRARIEKCFAGMGEGLQDAAGQVFNLKLVDDPELAVPITILPPSARGDMLHYTASMSCAAYIHESLHNVGLVDEYAETELKIGHTRAFNCRVVPARVSIMNDMYDFVSLFSESAEYEDFGAPLLPAHSRMILFPGCAQKNAGYGLCAHHAYQTHLQGWLMDGPACEMKAPVCSSTSWLD